MIKAILTILTILTLVITAKAQSLTLPAYVDYAIAHNLELTAESLNIEEAEGNLRAERHTFLPTAVATVNNGISSGFQQTFNETMSGEYSSVKSYTNSATLDVSVTLFKPYNRPKTFQPRYPFAARRDGCTHQPCTRHYATHQRRKQCGYQRITTTYRYQQPRFGGIEVNDVKSDREIPPFDVFYAKALEINPSVSMYKTQIEVAKMAKLEMFCKNVWGVDAKGNEAVEVAIQKTEAFFNSLGIKTRLSDYGIGEDVVNEIVRRFRERGLKLGEHGIVTPEHVEKILRDRL